MVALLHYAAEASEILAFLLVLREHRRRRYRPYMPGPAAPCAAADDTANWLRRLQLAPL